MSASKAASPPGVSPPAKVEPDAAVPSQGQADTVVAVAPPKLKGKPVSYFGLFRFCDTLDVFLYVVGVIGCIGQGVTFPLFTYIFSGLLNSFFDTAGAVAAINQCVRLRPRFSRCAALSEPNFSLSRLRARPPLRAGTRCTCCTLPLARWCAARSALAALRGLRSGKARACARSTCAR
jgi:hypothetical protein